VDSDEAFLAGIVHDVGKLIFYDAEPEQYERVFASSGPRRIVADEIDLFGIDHQEVGRLCADQWGLPREITSAIRAHHVPEQAEDNQALVNVICAADALAHLWQDTADDAETDLASMLEPSTLVLSQQQCAEVKEKVETEFQSLMEFFNS
jgi:HD-like signal output (HDOD) protein